VADRYGSLAIARRARYYAALCDIELGQRDKAAATLRELAGQGRGGALGPVLADLALAQVERTPGKYEQAIAGYTQLLNQSLAGFPRDYVLIRLAEAFEEAGRLSEAAAAFRRVVEEMPASPFADEARSRADYLKLAAEK
jgi:predicted Zn-dependent protease